jgi:hypothetical protein
MAQQNQPNCKTCQGGGVINAGGVVQECPSCDGTGKAYIPGLFYSYGVTVTLTANQQNVQTTISILNAPFKWIFATSQQTGAFSVLLADAKNSRQFFNEPLHYALIFGTAQHPFPVLNPWTFDQNGAIQITLNDLSGASNTIWLGFIGVQLVDSTQGT